jgi:hypothetical protein
LHVRARLNDPEVGGVLAGLLAGCSTKPSRYGPASGDDTLPGAADADEVGDALSADGTVGDPGDATPETGGGGDGSAGDAGADGDPATADGSPDLACAVHASGSADLADRQVPGWDPALGRSYDIRFPPAHDCHVATPVVVMLHGGHNRSIMATLSCPNADPRRSPCRQGPSRHEFTRPKQVECGRVSASSIPRQRIDLLVDSGRFVRWERRESHVCQADEGLSLSRHRRDGQDPAVQQTHGRDEEQAHLVRAM